MAPQDRPELVIGLVGSIGTDLAAVSSLLSQALTSVAYTSAEVHLSQSMRSLTVQPFTELPISEAVTTEIYYRAYMDAGNELRRRLGRDAVALLAIASIIEDRFDITHDAHVPRTSHAYILRSLKTPSEARLLRTLYGTRFLLVGAYDSDTNRETTLARKIMESHNDFEIDRWRGEARLLMATDEDERNADGQHVRDIFHQADFFVDWTRSPDARSHALLRFVHLLFGSPMHTPSREEAAMFHAFAASLRSGSLARQVGSAIIDANGALLATGTNEVPKFGGGQYWEGDDPDGRDIAIGSDAVNELQRRHLADTLDRLRSAEWLNPSLDSKSTSELVGEALSTHRESIGRSRIFSLIEFGRAVHAEMAAITDAAVRGVSLRGASLICTTFPCHECARHIVAAGIRRVLFIEPYPKSLVHELHQDSVSLGDEDEHRVTFLPFHGVAPPLFARVFRTPDGRKHADGKLIDWDGALASPRVDRADVLVYSGQIEADLVLRLAPVTATAEAGPSGSGEEGVMAIDPTEMPGQGS